ncbi:TIGR01666 family membrane protein [Vibrio sp. S11_S32]|uniref:YccS family putative transporter n=1 Tax=Vibrio sp. S11_S32 TaxID=2720225 RepID=UPI0016811CEC|nr:YccS family putative transporter [Vibrio sp. S11_S32]MBD1577541.1 TIGR01666 family membrane protein [Vibrio sp. S11_S32]
MYSLGQFRHYWSNKTINYCVRILIALLGVVLPCWYYQFNHEITPLILGVIAAALAETDDSFTGRLKALFLTFICFAIASFSIEILFPFPLLFALGLFTSTFGFIMLGAIGPRYASIAFGSLLIAIYTMLGIHISTDIWTQPTLLLLGAAWYSLVSMVWQIFWPMQPVQQGLANVFAELANYLEGKSDLFHPVVGLTPQPYRILETKLNASTVNALNQAKSTLLIRSKRGHVDGPSDRYLQMYFLAQDIHERISSSHYRYQDLAEHFSRSDVLFRFKHLMITQAKACRSISEALETGSQYQYDGDSILALDELQASMQYLKDQQNPDWKLPLAQLFYLFNNLVTVEKQLSNVSNPDASTMTIENTSGEANDYSLHDTTAHTPKVMWQRIRNNLHKDSMLFRHALRMSVVLTIGYAIIQGFDLERGYWIMLTSLFVCQPNFSATRQKLVARVIGTIVGLIVGSVLLTLFPSQESQLVFLVASGTLFFAFRMNNYGSATAFITLLVLFCFNQLGEGYAVILPRLADTIIGCGLAVLAVRYLLPDWEAKKLHRVMSEAIQANNHYLGHIIAQYRVGKRDDVNYRLARREAHTMDSTLSTTISNMLAEPDKYRKAIDESFRFLTLNHAMLSYISALGAHRKRIDDPETHLLILEAHQGIHDNLESLEQHLLIQESDISPTSLSSELDKRLSEWREGDDESVRLILQQLHLVYRMLPELYSLANKFSVRTVLDENPKTA